MKDKRYLFTSESVGEGHPDKLCDQVSDAVLDACLRDDRKAHVACECFATTGMVLIGFGDGSYRKIVIGVALVLAVWLDLVYRKRIK